MKTIGFILLAGGKSTRMGGSTPKTFLPLKGKPVARHSFDLLNALPFFSASVVVCPDAYQHFFPEHTRFQPPGERRQDSVANGFSVLDVDLVLIHDSARPLIKQEDIERLISLGKEEPAAALASPVSNTLKRVAPENRSLETVSRENLFEVYTPQLVQTSLLKQGLNLAKASNITVTDDLSLVELLGYTPLLLPSSYPNIKLTYPSDLPLIEALL